MRPEELTFNSSASNINALPAVGLANDGKRREEFAMLLLISSDLQIQSNAG